MSDKKSGPKCECGGCVVESLRVFLPASYGLGEKAENAWLCSAWLCSDCKRFHFKNKSGVIEVFVDENNKKYCLAGGEVSR